VYVNFEAVQEGLERWTERRDMRSGLVRRYTVYAMEFWLNCAIRVEEVKSREREVPDSVVKTRFEPGIYLFSRGLAIFIGGEEHKAGVEDAWNGHLEPN
jgi:hypothetical protein